MKEILDVLQEGIIVFDKDHKEVKFANKSAFKMIYEPDCKKDVCKVNLASNGI